MSVETLLESGLVRRDVALAPLTTYKFGGDAAYYAEPATVAELQALIEGFGGSQILMLGRGSNLVVADAGFDGVVIHLKGDFADFVIRDETVIAGAAVSLPVMARAAAKAGRGGLEWCVGVPGSVGGAVRMNAGCHGSEVADCLVTADVMDLGDGTVRALSATELELSYRHSNLTANDAVLGATFSTSDIDPTEGAAEIRRITQWRREHQPGGTLNAGSVFKNPEGDAAGRLIDVAGLKGYRRGGVAVSARHANFFEADTEATAQDLYDLVWDVRRQVGEGSGVWLEPEIRFIGAFRTSVDEGAP